MRLRLPIILLLAATGCGGSSSPSGPDSGGTTCSTCFLTGEWRLDNLSPCFFTGSPSDGGTPVTGVSSSVISGGLAQCPTSFTKPTAPWATSTLTADCPGHYTLCYTLKAGRASAPAAGDCVAASTCVSGDYTTAATAQSWPALPAYISSAAQQPCAQQMFQTGGYGEMSVSGSANGCGGVAKVLGHIAYCPQACNVDPGSAACGGCVPGGSGKF